MCGCGGNKPPQPVSAGPSPVTVGWAVIIPGGTKVTFSTKLAAEAYRQARNIGDPVVEVTR